MIDLSPEQRRMVEDILSRIVPGCEVRVFGSRANGKAARYSDLDLALVGENKLDWSLLEKVKDAFAESDLPMRVDVHDWNALSESFKNSIGKGYENLAEKQ